jgi:hypothetical protein
MSHGIILTAGSVLPAFWTEGRDGDKGRSTVSLYGLEFEYQR